MFLILQFYYNKNKDSKRLPHFYDETLEPRKDLFMKLKWIHTVFAALYLSLFSCCTTAFAASFGGRIDNVQADTIKGWAWDASSPDSVIDIELTISKVSDQSTVLTQTASADQYRADLESDGKGNGNHGFAVAISWASMEDAEYCIQVSAGGILLPGTLYYQAGTYSTVPSSVSSQLSGEGETATYLGSFQTTAYCPCRICSEGWGRRTSTGHAAVSNHTVAVDPKVIPYGSRLLINGVVYTAEDRGGAVRGNHIDIFFDTHAETNVYGTRNAEVYLLS